MTERNCSVETAVRGLAASVRGRGECSMCEDYHQLRVDQIQRTNDRLRHVSKEFLVMFDELSLGKY